jgi:hypothetical protein
MSVKLRLVFYKFKVKIINFKDDPYNSSISATKKRLFSNKGDQLSILK